VITLRTYQNDFINDIRAAMKTHRRVLGVAATGMGKTRCFASIVSSALIRSKRVVVAAHRVEIVEQISRALADLGVRHGRIQAGHSLTADFVQVAMVQTLINRIRKIPEPDLLILDEAHHSASSTYLSLLRAWCNARVLGVTATPERADGRGLGEAFDTLVEGPDTAFLIPQGFLADFDYFAPPPVADLSDVRTRAGDYALDDLAAAMDKSTITGDAAEHYRRLLFPRPAIAFCTTVAHAEHVAAQFCSVGLKAASVDGAMDRAVRADRIAAIGDGRLHVLTSCSLISEGVDIPVVGGVILLRPTKSLSLYLQSVGRALRPKPDGSRAVILDHVGNVNLHGSPKLPRLWSLNAKRRKDREASVRQCKVCFGVWAAGEKSDCANNSSPECLFTNITKSTEPFVAPEYVPGVLEMVSDRPAWAGGIDILRASGDEWRSLVARARTKEQLMEIARARNYKPQWPYVILKQRMQRGEGRAA
jgi:superfamily II DNA or RNA helicase